MRDLSKCFIQNHSDKLKTRFLYISEMTLYVTYFGKSKHRLIVDLEVDLDKAHAIALRSKHFGPKYDKRGKENRPE